MGKRDADSKASEGKNKKQKKQTKGKKVNKPDTAQLQESKRLRQLAFKQVRTCFHTLMLGFTSRCYTSACAPPGLAGARPPGTC